MFTRVMPAERTVRDAANALKRAAQERERDARRADNERAAFLRTRVGQARVAFERGDRVFQCALEVEREDAVILNAIAHEVNLRCAREIQGEPELLSHVRRSALQSRECLFMLVLVTYHCDVNTSRAFISR